MRHETISPVVQTLLTGRERISKGWCQRAGNQGVSFCAIEAITRDHAGVFMWNQLPVKNRDAVKLLQRCLPAGLGSVVAYNDALNTTQDDILALYDRAITLALSEEAIAAGWTYQDVTPSPYTKLLTEV